MDGSPQADWFSTNAPKQAGEDWFASNAPQLQPPPPAEPPSLASRAWAAATKPIGRQDFAEATRNRISGMAGMHLPPRIAAPVAYGANLLTAIPASMVEFGRRMTNPLTIMTAGAGGGLSALRAAPAVPAAVRTALGAVETAGGGAFGLQGLKQAVEPSPPGETGLQQFERRVGGAGQALLGGLAAGQGLREGLGKATEPIRGRMAERLAQSLLGPEPKGMPPVSSPARALVAEGPLAVSRKGGWFTKGLVGNLSKSLAEYNATIRRTLAASKEAPPEPLEPIVRKAVKPLMDQARGLGHPEIADRIEAWATRYLAAHPAEVPLAELHNLRRRMRSNQPLFKGTSEEFSDLKGAKKEVYRAMNEALDRRMPGFRDVTQRQSGLIQARQMLKEQARREAGGPILPTPRLYGGVSGGGGDFGAVRIGMPMPFETLLKTGAIKLLGKRLPLAEPTPAAPYLAPPLGPPEPGAVTPPRSMFPMPSFAKVTDFSQGAEGQATTAPVSPTEAGPRWNGIERRATERNPLSFPLGRGMLATLPEVAAPPEPGVTLPGLGQAVLENRAAAGRFQGEELGREFTAPRENVSAATGEMERESPLFRETGAGGQEGLFSKAQAARSAIAAPPPIPEAVKPPEVAKAPAGQGAALGPVLKVSRQNIVADPQRFQFRTELSRAMRSAIKTGAARFKPELSEGPITFWKDPADGKSYVVDGHHRLEIARRTGTSEIEARELNAPSYQAARAFGAYRNIASGHASAIDVAKFMRDTGIGPDHLLQEGISLGSELVSDGSRLANLDDSIFDQVVTGKLPERTGIAISQIADKTAQRGMLELLKRQQAKGGGLSYVEIEALARRATYAGSTETTGGLFGPVSESNAVAAARLEAYVRNRLSTDKRLFGFVSKGERPAELSRVGNVIKVPESKAIAEKARQGLEVFDRLISYRGPVNDAINEGVATIQRGAAEQPVRENTYQRVQEAVAKELRETQ